MYAWIWRKLPFGLPGKLVGSLVLIAAAVTLLWLVVFPWAEPLLPFDDVQVTQDGEPTAPGAPGNPGVEPGVEPGDGHELPYDTEQNNPRPTATRSR